jgi:hypothetical protein
VTLLRVTVNDTRAAWGDVPYRLLIGGAFVLYTILRLRSQAIR